MLIEPKKFLYCYLYKNGQSEHSIKYMQCSDWTIFEEFNFYRLMKSLCLYWFRFRWALQALKSSFFVKLFLLFASSRKQCVLCLSHELPLINNLIVDHMITTKMCHVINSYFLQLVVWILLYTVTVIELDALLCTYIRLSD